MTRHYKHLGLDERIEIEKGLDGGLTQAEIARRTGRAPSTVSRETKRRSWRPSNTSAACTQYRPAGLRTDQATARQYRATQAQARRQRASTRSHQPRRMTCDRLVAHVTDRLRQGWTPAETAGRLPLEHPDDQAVRVSHETVYAWVCHPANKHRALWQYLPRGRTRRRPRPPARRVRRAPQIKYRVPVSARPACVDDRREPGRWEADSVLGARGTGALHTEAERTSRFLWATKVPSTAAVHTTDAQPAMIKTLPAHAVRSTTCDNGSEFAWRYKVSDATGVPVYFATPYSAWQRGTNEHLNGRLRTYLPKRTRLDTAGPRKSRLVVA